MVWNWIHFNIKIKKPYETDRFHTLKCKRIK